MKISIHQIPKEGLTFDFSREKWLLPLIAHALPKDFFAIDSLSGSLQLEKFDKQVQAHADVRLALQSTCHRCLKPYPLNVRYRGNRLFVPLYESERQQRLEKQIQAAPAEEDLNFSYYRQETLDLGQFLVEQILLELPSIALCASDCKGLCPVCGTNRNDASCECSPKQKATHSPFGTLKNNFPLFK